MPLPCCISIGGVSKTMSYWNRLLLLGMGSTAAICKAGVHLPCLRQHGQGKKLLTWAMEAALLVSGVLIRPPQEGVSFFPPCEIEKELGSILFGNKKQESILLVLARIRKRLNGALILSILHDGGPCCMGVSVCQRRLYQLLTVI